MWQFWAAAACTLPTLVMLPVYAAGLGYAAYRRRDPAAARAAARLALLALVMLLTLVRLCHDTR